VQIPALHLGNKADLVFLPDRYCFAPQRLPFRPAKLANSRGMKIAKCPASLLAEGRILRFLLNPAGGLSMAESSNSSDSSATSAIHLLDSAIGRPIRSWQFTGKQLISIGRADECDVQISDPFVSRNHAELRAQADGWTLVSLGRHGVIVQGETVTEFPITGEAIFRLGSGGPTLRFNPVASSNDNRTTMMFDGTAVEDIFELDHIKVDREVSEIADADYFQQLQERAKQLRQQRK
jgi:hypothetical protein